MPGAMIVDHVLEFIDAIREDLENISDVLFEVLELWVVKMHDLEVGEDLQHLLVEILGHGVHQENGS